MEIDGIVYTEQEVAALIVIVGMQGCDGCLDKSMPVHDTNFYVIRRTLNKAKRHFEGRLNDDGTFRVGGA